LSSQPGAPAAADVAAKQRIDALYRAFPYDGARRMAAPLRRAGLPIDRTTARRSMQAMGLIAVYPGPNLRKRHRAHRVFPSLLRNVTPKKPNHVWGTDSTAIRLRNGWMDLVVVLDWYARSSVRWAVDDTLELPFVLAAARQAVAPPTPQIGKSDQGRPVTSPQWSQMVLASGAQLRMDGKGRALDTLFTERRWRTITYDHVFRHDDATPREARPLVRQFVRVSNERRLHEALGYRPPADVSFAAAAEVVAGWCRPMRAYHTGQGRQRGGGVAARPLRCVGWSGSAATGLVLRPVYN
jgi:putative transposase